MKSNFEFLGLVVVGGGECDRKDGGDLTAYGSA